MVKSAGGRHDELIAELFEQWQSRIGPTSPPRDGTVFYGLNLNTGHVYETWFEEKTAAWDTKGAVKLLQQAFDPELGNWWCYEAGRGITSFIFQVWAPRTPAEHHTVFIAGKNVYRTPIGAASRATRKPQPEKLKSLGPCTCGAFTVAWDDGVPLCLICEKPRTVYGKPYCLSMGQHPYGPYHELSDGYRPAWARGGYSRSDFTKAKEHWAKQPKFVPTTYPASQPDPKSKDQSQNQTEAPSHTPLPPLYLSLLATSKLIH